MTDKTGASRGDSKAATFKTFPEFSKLTSDNKSEYEALIARLSPMIQVSFADLMTWWDPFEIGVSIALLNGNLVIHYWLPGDEKHAGFSLIGINDIDVSICTIFDYLRYLGEPVRLVNVPELVVRSIRYTELFNSIEQRKYHEYIIDISSFYPLKNMSGFKRRRVERVLNRVEQEAVLIKSLDLEDEDDKQLLLQASKEWQQKNVNDFGLVEREAIERRISNAAEYGIENLCLFVNQELYGFCLYHWPVDKRYVFIPHIKATHKDALWFDLIGYSFARWFAEQGVKHANVGPDRGLLRLRMFMLTLGPVEFVRKYKIEPGA